jgi:hypothetical protein
VRAFLTRRHEQNVGKRPSREVAREINLTSRHSPCRIRSHFDQVATFIVAVSLASPFDKGNSVLSDDPSLPNFPPSSTSISAMRLETTLGSALHTLPPMLERLGLGIESIMIHAKTSILLLSGLTRTERARQSGEFARHLGRPHSSIVIARSIERPSTC